MDTRLTYDELDRLWAATYTMAYAYRDLWLTYNRLMLECDAIYARMRALHIDQ